MEYFKACTLAELSSEKPTAVTLDGVSVCLVLSAQGAVFAFENKCSHEDKPLNKGKWDSATCFLTCPFHQAVFALAENAVAKVGPAVLPLQIFPVERRQESGFQQIYVGLDSED